jgi:PAS domain S-box-containing protein
MALSLDKILESKDASLALLQVLAENSFDSILVTDASSAGKIIYANKAFKKLTGHDPADVLGQTPRILQGPGTDKKVIGRLSSALRAGGRFEGKAINYKKDGTPFSGPQENHGLGRNPARGLGHLISNQIVCASLHFVKAYRSPRQILPRR